MAFADDLLEQARHLASRERKNPREASLRRAVSTAYYALFHLLISEATLNWKRPEQRDALGRVFEHGKMKSACQRQVNDLNAYFKTKPLPGRELRSAEHLHAVSETFIEAQQKRHAADYDNSRVWTRTAVRTQIESVANAFQSWRAIRNEPASQAYLVSLFGGKEPSKN
ncbi:MAG: hypothetical protein QOG67_3329 [Verrucomicrobiota bacterium]